MAAAPYLRSPFGAAKRLKVSRTVWFGNGRERLMVEQISNAKPIYPCPAQRATFIRDFDMLRSLGYDPKDLASVVK